MTFLVKRGFASFERECMDARVAVAPGMDSCEYQSDEETNIGRSERN